MRNAILLSYPRCGNSWLRFCVEFLSQRKTTPNSPNAQKFRESVGLEFDTEKFLMFKYHGWRDVKEDLSDSIILLLRNYKECIPRHCRRIEDDATSHGETHPLKFSYIDNLLYFERSSFKNKHVVYYEDLIVQPMVVLRDLLNFLDVDDGRLLEFFERYDEIKDKSIEAYSESQTQGKEVLVHSKKFSREEILKFDELVKAQSPECYEKYLIRYYGV